jgi:hypothetical protein
MEKICFACQKIFYSNFLRQRWCSYECKKKYVANKKEKYCKKCNNLFLGNKSQKYCSKDCRPHKILLIKKCDFCLKNFETYRKNQSCCNKLCQKNKNNLYYKKWAYENKNYIKIMGDKRYNENKKKFLLEAKEKRNEERKQKPKKFCKNCNIEYINRHKFDYCSKNCRLENYKKEQSKNVEQIFLKRQKYYQNHKSEVNYNNYLRKLRMNKNDLNWILASRIRGRLRHCLIIKNITTSKQRHTLQYIGCDINTLRSYLEKQFKEGMTWNNYGKKGWEIDHIIPCSYFDFSKEKNIYICFNYKNLQPLWRKENLQKSNKIPEILPELLIKQ